MFWNFATASLIGLPMFGGGFLLFKSAKGLIRIGFYVFFRGRQCFRYGLLQFFTHPWEVFSNVHDHERGPTMDEIMPFELSTVAATADLIEATGGLKIIPDYTVENAPTPDLVIVPAFEGNPALLEWLASVAPKTDVTMSVCTGSFQLAEAGLLDGLVATTHHKFYESFSKHYPQVTLVRDVRFVQNQRISRGGGFNVRN